MEISIVHYYLEVTRRDELENRFGRTELAGFWYWVCFFQQNYQGLVVDST